MCTHTLHYVTPFELAPSDLNNTIQVEVAPFDLNNTIDKQ